jgi:hypothetical protein
VPSSYYTKGFEGFLRKKGKTLCNQKRLEKPKKRLEKPKKRLGNPKSITQVRMLTWVTKKGNTSP